MTVMFPRPFTFRSEVRSTLVFSETSTAGLFTIDGELPISVGNVPDNKILNKPMQPIIKIMPVASIKPKKNAAFEGRDERVCFMKQMVSHCGQASI